jgi:NAD(P)-dependent dehydrogenase (short-subunit alcohol dehydrogenase family)/pimeloyl-ACP methyl ester carboxylesterase
VIAEATARTVRSGDVELAVAEVGDRSRATLILVHGYPDTKEIWDLVVPKLAPRFHVVTYDVRGSGASTVPHGAAAYDFARLGDDLEAVIDAVSPQQPVHLVGHDWGGIAGWELVTMPRFAGKLLSFTTIAGPSLDQIGAKLRELLRHGRVLEVLKRTRRSFYVPLLCTPGLPGFWWQVAMAEGSRWRAYLKYVERVPIDARYPVGNIATGGVAQSNLYRRNIPGRISRPHTGNVARVPVQVIVPSKDRWISPDYYDMADRHAPIVRRRTLPGSHWAPRSQPRLVARWIESFVEDVSRGDPLESSRPWVRGGGVEQLRDRLALVTGAGSGIGRATALALASHGARLLLVDRDSEAVGRTATEIPGAHTFTCDVGDEAAMERLHGVVTGEHGVPDIVVNNAGIGVGGSFFDIGFDDWRRIIDVNLMGVVHGCRLFGQSLVDRGEGGHIVNTASAAAYTPSKELSAYAATKAAVLMLSECLRAEAVAHGIGVTAVCPGVVATNITRTTKFVGRSEADQLRVSDAVTKAYERRNFTPEQVAAEIVKAIATDKPVAAITPEAKLGRVLSRLAPGALRRLAGIDAVPV